MMKPLEDYHFDVDLPEESKVITLVVTDGGDRYSYDHADWANAGFLSTKKPAPEPPGEGPVAPVTKPPAPPVKTPPVPPVKKPPTPGTKPPPTTKPSDDDIPDWMKKGAEKSTGKGWLVP